MQQRGLTVPNVAEAEHYLAQLNYYRLAAYCLPFEQDHATHQYIQGTTFDDILNLYVFDRELRLLVLDGIERIEVSLRTQMAYHLSHNHNTPHPHLNPGIFHSNRKYQNAISKMTDDVRNSREDFIRHLTSKYQEQLPPIWAVVELMTMGQLSKWFSNIKARRDRNAICGVYGLDERVMTSFCEHLSLVRNHAAHHARLWNRDFTKTMTLPRRGPSALLNSILHLPDTDRKLRKIYNTLVMINYLLDIICPGHHWKQHLKELIQRHNVDTTKMAFPASWQALPMWQ